MGPSAPPNRLGRPGSSHYLIDSIGVSPSYRLSRPFRPTYVLCFCLSPPALKFVGSQAPTNCLVRCTNSMQSYAGGLMVARPPPHRADALDHARPADSAQRRGCGDDFC